RGFAMSHAIPVRADYTAGEVRQLAQRAKDAAQARRLLAIAAVLDGACRCRRAHPNSTARKTFGSSCVRIGCQTGSSNPSTISSTTDPSRDVIGQQSVTQSEDWYKMRCDTIDTDRNCFMSRVFSFK